MKNCSIFVGNSSTGVREIPFLGIASLDIGSRQFNRASNKSIEYISPFDKKKILYFLEKNWNKKYDKNFEYGKGNAAEKFVKILLTKNIWDESLQKNFKDSL